MLSDGYSTHIILREIERVYGGKDAAGGMMSGAEVALEEQALRGDEAKMNEAVENVYMDIFDFLRNNIPGVVVSQTEMVGDIPHIEVRGNRSIFETQGEPLFLLDGNEYPNIQDLRPEHVHSVQVMAGPSASAYGSRGANGVIMFKSKAAYETEQAELARRKAERQARKNK